MFKKFIIDSIFLIFHALREIMKERERRQREERIKKKTMVRWHTIRLICSLLATILLTPHPIWSWLGSGSGRTPSAAQRIRILPFFPPPNFWIILSQKYLQNIRWFEWIFFIILYIFIFNAYLIYFFISFRIKVRSRSCLFSAEKDSGSGKKFPNEQNRREQDGRM